MQYFYHSPIEFSSLTISFGLKECITTPFTTTIMSGCRIAIIGRNGSGKSSLMKAIAGFDINHEGILSIPDDIISGYIPQLIDNEDGLSGGERFNKALSQTLALQPNLLLLDEPTNHLDRKNREALFGLLRRYTGTLIIITHDVELLNLVDTLWHVAHGSINVFNGRYNDYLEQEQQKLIKLTASVKQLNREKKQVHDSLMQEQQRAKNSRLSGEKHIKERKWPTITSGAKARRAEMTSGKNSKRIDANKQDIINELGGLYIPEVIVPKFNLESGPINPSKMVLLIENGECGYDDLQQSLITNINLQLMANDKIAILGSNGSGKSTLIKAIIGNSKVKRSGSWTTPNDIGYLDQHYANLEPEMTAVNIIENLVPNWSLAEIRNHLNTFLLRKNEEVNIATKYLSGGERVRLSLAVIAANPPKLLILDEVTNNVDLETREHLMEVIREYPGSVILICHDYDFLEQLELDNTYQIETGRLISML